MKEVFCTIITANYLPYAKALYHSLNKVNNPATFFTLIVDSNVTLDLDFNILTLDIVVLDSSLGHKIVEKYKHPNTLDQLRWSLKPIVINYLFGKGYEKVIFTDPDTYYFSPIDFLINELDEHDVILTPHWRGLSYKANNYDFNAQFYEGLFNAGFIAVHCNAKEIMNWWAEMCFYKCEIDKSNGHYVDQTYLNLMPIYFDRVGILRHRGCNVAVWNQIECKRILQDNKVLINGKWDVVFIHFTNYTIQAILYGSDQLLLPYLEEYLKALRFYGFSVDTMKYAIKNEKLQRSTYWRLKNWVNKKLISLH